MLGCGGSKDWDLKLVQDDLKLVKDDLKLEQDGLKDILDVYGKAMLMNLNKENLNLKIWNENCLKLYKENIVKLDKLNPMKLDKENFMKLKEENLMKFNQGNLMRLDKGNLMNLDMEKIKENGMRLGLGKLNELSKGGKLSDKIKVDMKQIVTKGKQLFEMFM